MNPADVTGSEQSRLPDLREHLAAERTFLAYIRTGLAMMGFGFLIARFGRAESAAMDGNPHVWFGAGLVFFGVLLNIVSIFEYRALIHRMNAAHATHWPPAKLPVITAAVVAGCGALLGAYVVTFP